VKARCSDRSCAAAQPPHVRAPAFTAAGLPDHPFRHLPVIDGRARTNWRENSATSAVALRHSRRDVLRRVHISLRSMQGLRHWTMPAWLVASFRVGSDPERAPHTGKVSAALNLNLPLKSILAVPKISRTTPPTVRHLRQDSLEQESILTERLRNRGAECSSGCNAMPPVNRRRRTNSLATNNTEEQAESGYAPCSPLPR
jgi:hypothetical protein